jgi:hypothetical protein
MPQSLSPYVPAAAAAVGFVRYLNATAQTKSSSKFASSRIVAQAVSRRYLTAGVRFRPCGGTGLVPSSVSIIPPWRFMLI